MAFSDFECQAYFKQMKYELKKEKFNWGLFVSYLVVGQKTNAIICFKEPGYKFRILKIIDRLICPSKKELVEFFINSKDSSSSYEYTD